MWSSWLFRPEPTQPPIPLTEDGLRVFQAAVQAARRCRHDYIGTEHLLLGFAESGPSPGVEALERAGISAEVIRQHCRPEPEVGPISGRLPLTPTVIRVFSVALREAQLAGSASVGSLGLLIVLAREEEGVARQLLARMVFTHPAG